LDYLYDVRYWPALSVLHALARAHVREGRGVGMGFPCLVGGYLRSGHENGDVVEKANSRQLSSGILVFRLGEE
jgi:hypothetical protein